MVEYHVPRCLYCSFGSAVMALEAFLSEEEAYLDFANLLLCFWMEEEILQRFFYYKHFFIICCGRKILIPFTRCPAFDVRERSFVLHPVIDEDKSMGCVWETILFFFFFHF